MYKALFVLFVCVPFWTFVHIAVATTPRIQVAVHHFHILP